MRRGQRRADCFRRISISHGLQSYDGDPLSVGFSTRLTRMSAACPRCNTGQIRLQGARRNIPTAGLFRITARMVVSARNCG
jgi:hypothetical protein